MASIKLLTYCCCRFDWYKYPPNGERVPRDALDQTSPKKIFMRISQHMLQFIFTFPFKKPKEKSNNTKSHIKSNQHRLYIHSYFKKSAFVFDIIKGN